MNIKITLDELIELMHYSAEKGYRGKVSLLLNLKPGEEISIDKMKSIIDDAVTMEQHHRENLSSVTDQDREQQLLNQGIVSID